MDNHQSHPPKLGTMAHHNEIKKFLDKEKKEKGALPFFRSTPFFKT
jgi:hypothetical protein